MISLNFGLVLSRAPKQNLSFFFLFAFLLTFSVVADFILFLKKKKKYYYGSSKAKTILHHLWTLQFFCAVPSLEVHTVSAIRALRSKADRTSAWPASAHLSLSPHGKSTLMMYSSIYWINAGLPLEKLHDTADTRSRRSLQTLWRSTVAGLSENLHLRTVENFPRLTAA